MQPSEEQVIELMSGVVCEVCGVRYAPEGIEVLGRRDATWFLRVTCAECRHRGLIAAQVKTITPSLAAEASVQPGGLEPGVPITRSDVRKMRQFLDGFDGDFRSLFAA